MMKMMNAIYKPIINVVMICLMGILPEIASASFPDIQKKGTIHLNNFSTQGLLAYNLETKMELIAGVEIISLQPVGSNVYKFDMTLNPRRDNQLRFYSSYDFGDNVSGQGYCTIKFDEVTQSQARFTVIEDTTLYGCGIDTRYSDWPYIYINF